MIKVQCVSCKAVKELSLAEAENLDGPPSCDKCPMFCVAVAARVSSRRSGKDLRKVFK